MPTTPVPVDMVVIAPLTGRAAGLGEQMRTGARAAVAAINAQGGIAGRPIRLEILDDACSPREAVSVLQRVLAGSARLLVGPLCSGAAAAIRPLLQEEGAVAVLPAQVDALTAAPGNRTPSGLPVLFRVTPANGMIADRLVERLNQRQPHGAVALVSAHDAFGQDIKTAAAAALARLNRTLAVEVEIASGERDFSAIATRLKAAGVAAVIFGGYASEAGPFLRQIRAAGVEAGIYGPGTLTDRETCVDRAACQGVIVAGSNQHAGADSAARRRLQAELGRGIEDGEAFAASAVEVLAAAAAAALHQTGSLEPAAIRRALLAGTFASVTGPVRFTDAGERAAPAVRLRIYRDGQLEAFEDAPVR